jgi:hypothetical protein
MGLFDGFVEKKTNVAIDAAMERIVPIVVLIIRIGICVVIGIDVKMSMIGLLVFALGVPIVCSILSFICHLIFCFEKAWILAAVLNVLCILGIILLRHMSIIRFIFWELHIPD